jgi:hypothetical protein
MKTECQVRKELQAWILTGLSLFFRARLEISLKRMGIFEFLK